MKRAATSSSSGWRSAASPAWSIIPFRCIFSRSTPRSEASPGILRVSERASREVLSIPLYPELTRAQIERVAQEVRRAALQAK